MLTERQKNFCREYIIDFRLEPAMRRAGYSAKNANRNGYLFLRDPDITMYIKQLTEQLIEKQKLSAEMVLEEMRRLAFSDVKDFYKWSPAKNAYVLKPLHELTKDQTAAIEKYEPGKGYTLYNKDGALDKLAKYFKLYSDKLDPIVNNYMLLPELKLNGKKLEFNIGKPAPRREKKD